MLGIEPWTPGLSAHSTNHYTNPPAWLDRVYTDSYAACTGQLVAGKMVLNGA